MVTNTDDDMNANMNTGSEQTINNDEHVSSDSHVYVFKPALLMLALMLLLVISIACIIMSLNASTDVIIQVVLVLISSAGFIITGWLSCMLLCSHRNNHAMNTR